MRLSYLSPSLLTLLLACSSPAGTVDPGSSGTGGADGDSLGDGDVSEMGMDSGVPTGSGGTDSVPGIDDNTPGTGGSTDGSGGSEAVDDCVPNVAGGFVVEGDVVRDETNCLVWQKGSFTGPEIQPLSSDPGENGNGQGTQYDAAAACEALELGGYDDWRLPHIGEMATIATRCKDWGNDPPWAVELDVSDNVWTSTPAGAKFCVVQVSGGGVPDSSYSGGPGARCVRGPATVPDAECATTAIPSCGP